MGFKYTKREEQQRMSKLKVGVVGVSRGGSYMMKYANNARTEVTAICDLDQKRLEAVSKDLNLQDSQVYTDYDAFLNSDIDIGY